MKKSLYGKDKLIVKIRILIRDKNQFSLVIHPDTPPPNLNLNMCNIIRSSALI